MNMNTTNKVYTKSSTTTTDTGTSTTASQWQTYNRYKAEQGWECPRCGRINAPWVRQCDCSRGTDDYNKWIVTPTWTDDEWWKTYLNSQANANTYINKDKVEVGGSDYWNPTTKEWKNVDINISNNNFDNLKAPKR